MNYYSDVNVPFDLVKMANQFSRSQLKVVKSFTTILYTFIGFFLFFLQAPCEYATIHSRNNIIITTAIRNFLCFGHVENEKQLTRTGGEEGESSVWSTKLL